ncbi:MAG: hypothetical protein HYZ27_08935 [Deltaproteobacteria bacterium]|nr:hypothetical protein [Deltaproteobacteria bacterium]
MQAVTGQIESLRRLLQQVDELQRQSLSDLDNKKLAADLRNAASLAVGELAGLDSEQRRRLSPADRKSLQQLAGLSFLSQEKRNFVLGVSSAESLHLAGVAGNKAKQDVTLAAHAGPMGVQALVQGLKDRQPAEGSAALTASELALRKSDTAVQRALAFLDDVADGNALARMKQAGESSVATARKLVDSAPAAERPAAQAQLAQYQKSLSYLDQLGWMVGPQAAGIDRSLLDEAIFHKRGLPSRLSPAQRAFVDHIDARAFDPQHFQGSPLAASMGQALAAGQPDAAAALAAKALGLTSADVAQLSPAVAQQIAASGNGAPAQLDDATVEKNLSDLKLANRDAWQVIHGYREGREKYRANAKQTFSEIMSLLSSGMPIEMVIMLVMLLLTERQEEKFNLKVQEMTAFEQLNRMNEPVQRRIDALTASSDPDKIAKIAELEQGLANPEKYGLQSKSTTIVMQELQVEMQMFMQMMQALSAVLRQIQDLILTPVRNIR